MNLYALSAKPSATLGTTQGIEKGTTCLAGGLESKSLGNVITQMFLPLSTAPLMFWPSTRQQSQLLKREDAHPMKSAPLRCPRSSPPSGLAPPCFVSGLYTSEGLRNKSFPPWMPCPEIRLLLPFPRRSLFTGLPILELFSSPTLPYVAHRLQASQCSLQGSARAGPVPPPQPPPCPLML